MNGRSLQVKTDWHWLALAALGSVFLFWLNGRPEAAGLLAPPWDKAAHALIFGMLAWLLGRGLCGRLALAFVLIVALAASDELRQLSLPGRFASWSDFATDVTAAGAVLLWQGMGVK